MKVAKISRDLGYGNPAVSDATFCAIAANDAICMRFARKKPQGDSHSEAPRLLQEAAKGQSWEGEAKARADQFVSIVGRKSDAQYRGVKIPPEEVDRIVKQAERFLDWAEGVLRSR